MSYLINIKRIRNNNMVFKKLAFMFYMLRETGNKSTQDKKIKTLMEYFKKNCIILRKIFFFLLFQKFLHRVFYQF